MNKPNVTKSFDMILKQIQKKSEDELSTMNFIQSLSNILEHSPEEFVKTEDSSVVLKIPLKAASGVYDLQIQMSLYKRNK